MKHFIKNPFLKTLVVLIFMYTLSLPIILTHTEKTILLSSIISCIYFASTIFVCYFYKMSFDTVNQYKKKLFVWTMVIAIILFYVLSAHKKDYSIYIHSNIMYTYCVDLSLIFLMIANILNFRNKSTSVLFYRISIFSLYLLTILSCCSLFRIQEGWIF